MYLYPVWKCISRRYFSPQKHISTNNNSTWAATASALALVSSLCFCFLPYLLLPCARYRSLKCFPSVSVLSCVAHISIVFPFPFHCLICFPFAFPPRFKPALLSISCVYITWIFFFFFAIFWYDDATLRLVRHPPVVGSQSPWNFTLSDTLLCYRWVLRQVRQLQEHFSKDCWNLWKDEVKRDSNSPLPTGADCLTAGCIRLHQLVPQFSGRRGCLSLEVFHAVELLTKIATYCRSEIWARLMQHINISSLLSLYRTPFNNTYTLGVDEILLRWQRVCCVTWCAAM